MIYSNPSFETEKHTHAFGAMLWWAVSLISMFTVGTGVTAIGLCGASVLKITSRHSCRKRWSYLENHCKYGF